MHTSGDTSWHQDTLGEEALSSMSKDFTSNEEFVKLTGKDVFLYNWEGTLPNRKRRCNWEYQLAWTDASGVSKATQDHRGYIDQKYIYVSVGNTEKDVKEVKSQLELSENADKDAVDTIETNQEGRPQDRQYKEEGTGGTVGDFNDIDRGVFYNSNYQNSSKMVENYSISFLLNVQYTTTPLIICELQKGFTKYPKSMMDLDEGAELLLYRHIPLSMYQTVTSASPAVPTVATVVPPTSATNNYDGNGNAEVNQNMKYTLNLVEGKGGGGGCIVVMGQT